MKTRFQAVISVGRFGRKVFTEPRRWKWLAKWDADSYCFCEMRETSYHIQPVVGNDYRLGAYLFHPEGEIEAI